MISKACADELTKVWRSSQRWNEEKFVNEIYINTTLRQKFYQSIETSFKFALTESAHLPMNRNSEQKMIPTHRLLAALNKKSLADVQLWVKEVQKSRIEATVLAPTAILRLFIGHYDSILQPPLFFSDLGRYQEDNNEEKIIESVLILLRDMAPYIWLAVDQISADVARPSQLACLLKKYCRSDSEMKQTFESLVISLQTVASINNHDNDDETQSSAAIHDGETLQEEHDQQFSLTSFFETCDSFDPESLVPKVFLPVLSKARKDGDKKLIALEQDLRDATSAVQEVSGSLVSITATTRIDYLSNREDGVFAQIFSAKENKSDDAQPDLQNEPPSTPPSQRTKKKKTNSRRREKRKKHKVRQHTSILEEKKSQSLESSAAVLPPQVSSEDILAPGHDTFDAVACEELLRMYMLS